MFHQHLLSLNPSLLFLDLRTSSVQGERPIPRMQQRQCSAILLSLPPALHERGSTCRSLTEPFNLEAWASRWRWEACALMLPSFAWQVDADITKLPGVLFLGLVKLQRVSGCSLPVSLGQSGLPCNRWAERRRWCSFYIDKFFSLVNHIIALFLVKLKHFRNITQFV